MNILPSLRLRVETEPSDCIGFQKNSKGTPLLPGGINGIMQFDRRSARRCRYDRERSETAMDQIDRIKAMEAKMVRAQETIRSLEKALDAYAAAQPAIGELGDYLASDAWKEDFAADENGLLPQELRRGVLSEDGIYNLLEDNAALMRRLSTAGRSRKKK